jgi:pyruvate/2-oxoglutarate dehydrogenase complex dihydrolipoamide dehydrogenase (E3) component
MAEMLTPDICVIGGGAAGIAVARRAVADGIPVILVEKRQIGGANLSQGAIPAHALAAAAEQHEHLRRGPALGVTGAPLQVNFGKVSEHIRTVGQAMAAQVSAERLTAFGVRVIAAPARFLDRRTVIAGDFTIAARRFVIAAGALPAPPPIPGLNEVDYLTPAGAFEMTRKPGHLLVLGANAHALELAQAYNRLGVDTTVLDNEAALPGEDPELAQVVLDRLRAEGVRIRDRTTIAGFVRRRGGIRATVVEDGEETAVDGSHLLVVAGRAPNVGDLGLDAAAVAYDDAGVTVDSQLRTTNKRIYAIGDVVAGPALAGRAEDQARCVVASIAFRWTRRSRPIDAPVVTFTNPGLARIGLSENEARARKIKMQILRFPLVENDRAQIERMPYGFVKVIVSPRGRVLGAAVVGDEAAEQIALWALVLAGGINIRTLADLVVPYPTRAAGATRLAAGFEGGGLTPLLRRRIIEFLRKFG